MKFVKQLLLSQKSFYALLIAMAAIISIYFWISAARIFFSNLALDSQSPARVIQWEVQEVGSDRYALAAYYSFEIKETVYHGKTLFAHPTYLNPASAISALKEKAKQTEPWAAWYHQADPTRSALEKVFPRGILFRAILSSAVLIYLVFFTLRQRIHSQAM